MSGRARHPLLLLLSRVRRRAILARAVRLGSAGALYGAVAAVAAAVIWMDDLPAALRLLALPLLSGLVGVLLALWRPPSPRQVARRIDRELGLAERLETALELVRQRDEVAGLVRRDALLHLDRVDPRALVPLRAGGSPRAAVLALAAIVGLTLAVEQLAGGGGAARPRPGGAAAVAGGQDEATALAGRPPGVVAGAAVPATGPASAEADADASAGAAAPAPADPPTGGEPPGSAAGRAGTSEPGGPAPGDAAGPGASGAQSGTEPPGRPAPRVAARAGDGAGTGEGRAGQGPAGESVGGGAAAGDPPATAAGAGVGAAAPGERSPGAAGLPAGVGEAPEPAGGRARADWLAVDRALAAQRLPPGLRRYVRDYLLALRARG